EADSPHESPEDTPSYPTSVASRALLFRDHQKASTSSQPYIQAITSGTERRVWAVLQGEDLLRAVREAHKANMPETVSRLLELTEQLDSIQAQVAGLNEELEAFDLEFRGIMTTVRKAQERGHNGG
ncbi:MAG: hypothetical protein JXR94_19610, partial [Candidatus Hydrogenedentes bacterium]|nr:hypothetical protein [Candidatus Hydrogenedentota bacterium]